MPTNSPARPDSPSRPDLEGLKVLEARATPGDWEESDGDRRPNYYLEIRGPYDGDVNGDTGQHIVVGGEPICAFLDNERDYQDSAFIIAMRNNFTSLIAHVERLEASASDAVATLAAVRATTISDDEWQESRMHFRELCGQTIAEVNATLSQGNSHE